MTTTTLNTPPNSLEHTIAQPSRRRSRAQFSLAALLLFVLWVASGVLVWLHWQPWVVVGEFPGSSEFFFSKDNSKILMSAFSEPTLVDVRTGEVTRRPPIKSGWPSYCCLSAGWEKFAGKWEEKDHSCRIEIYDYRNGELEQSVPCNMYDRVFHLSKDGERLFLNRVNGSIWVYCRKQDEAEWGIPVLSETEQQEGDASPPVPISPEDAKRLQACERAVVAAQTMADLKAAVEHLDRVPHESSWICTDLNPYADLAVTRVITKDEKRTYSWDLLTGRRGVELEAYDASQYDSPVFCRDGRSLGAVDKEHAKVAVWDLNTGRMSASWKVADAPLEDGGILALAPEGRSAVLRFGNSNRLWECSTGRLVAELPSPGPFGNWDFDTEGKRLAVAIEKEGLTIFDADSGARLCTLPSPDGRCGVALKYAPDGNSMVATGMDAFLVGTLVYFKHHSESEYGVLALPEIWVFIALSLIILLIILWRTVHWAMAFRRVRPA